MSRTWLLSMGGVFAVASMAAFALPDSIAAKPVPNFRIEQSVDRPGMDYKSFFVNNFGQCQSACLADGRCLSFTYVHPRKQPPYFNNASPICWLKTGVPGGRQSDCCVSGVKMQSGTVGAGTARRSCGSDRDCPANSICLLGVCAKP